MAIYFHLEGCNFAGTLDDTGDLSTIRGASLAYIDAPHLLAGALGDKLGVALEPVIEAASIGYYRVVGEVTPEDLETAMAELLAAGRPSPVPDAGDDMGGEADRRDLKLLTEVLPHLTFTYAAGRLGDGDTGTYLQLSRLLGGRARIRQFRRPTVDLPACVKGTVEPCEIDGIRPRGGSSVRRGPRTVPASDSVFARRNYGRRMKQAFYRREAGYDAADRFAESFDDLVDKPPPGLKSQLANKVGVIYLDGNAFGALQTAVVRPAQQSGEAGLAAGEAADRHLSIFLRDRRRDLLAALLGMIDDDPRMVLQREDGTKVRRFETLLWGGDESTFILPGWKVPEALRLLAGALGAENWTYVPENPGGGGAGAKFLLTHSVGVAIGNVHTPIRYLKKLAGSLADEAKSAIKAEGDDTPWSAGNACQIAILESVEPPLNGIAEYCRDYYGVWDTQSFTLSLDRHMENLAEAMTSIIGTEGGLPRSQLFNILQKGAELRGPDGLVDSAAVEAMLGEFGVRQMRKVGTSDRVAEFFRSSQSGLGYSQRTPLLPYQRCAQFWDYFSPFSDHPAAG